MSLNIEYNKNSLENYVEVIPSGDIDIYTSPDFKKNVFSIIENDNANILVNAEKLEYLDSTGLGAFMGIYKLLKEKNLYIKITNLKPNIYKLFEITGLDKVFGI